MSKNRIGIFGGTFNPPHIGHIAAARQVVAALDLGKLLMIPTNIPPHKQLPEGSASPEQRLEMVGIAASMIPMAEACDIEIRREGASYTADTVAALKEIYPEATLWLMIGTDMIDTFDRWYCPEKIVAHCRLAAVARGDDDHALQSSATATSAWSLRRSAVISASRAFTVWSKPDGRKDLEQGRAGSRCSSHAE